MHNLITFHRLLLNLTDRYRKTNRERLCLQQGSENAAATVKVASMSEKVFTAYGDFLMKKPVKVLLLLFSLGVTAVGILGNVLMEQQFDPSWFLTPGSYPYNWTIMNKKYFPNGGDRVTVWCSGVDYVNELEELHALSLRLSIRVTL